MVHDARQLRVPGTTRGTGLWPVRMKRDSPVVLDSLRIPRRCPFARATSYIPEKWRLPLGAMGTMAVILIGTFTSPESADNTQANRVVSLFGLLVFIFVFYITSHNRHAINWHTVIVGMLAQFILALFVGNVYWAFQLGDLFYRLGL